MKGLIKMDKSNYKLYHGLKDDIKELFNEAQAALHVFMEAAEKVQVMTDLKLYDIAFEYLDDTEESINNFTWFCDIEYLNFKDFLKDRYLELNYIGRTSSLYIAPTSFSGNRFTDIDIGYIYGAHVLSEYDDVDDLLINIINSNSDIDDLINALYDVLNDLELFISDTLVEMKDDLVNVAAAYKYIENFKEDQLVHYENFLHND